MELLVLFLLGILFFTVLTIKLAAKLLGLESPGAGVCVLATILSAVISGILLAFVGDGFLAFVVSLFVTGGVYTLVFGVNTVVGFVLAFVAMVIQFASMFAMTILGLSVGMISMGQL